MAVVACPSCGKKFQVGPKAFGQTIPCPNCRRDIFVPPADLAGDLDLGGQAPAADPLDEMLGSASRAAPARPHPSSAPAAPPATHYPPGPAHAGYGAAPPYSPPNYHGPAQAPPHFAPPAYQPPAPTQFDLLSAALPPNGAASGAPASNHLSNPIFWAAMAVPAVALLLLTVQLWNRYGDALVENDPRPAAATAAGDGSATPDSATPDTETPDSATPGSATPAPAMPSRATPAEQADGEAESGRARLAGGGARRKPRLVTGPTAETMPPPPPESPTKWSVYVDGPSWSFAAGAPNGAVIPARGRLSRVLMAENHTPFGIVVDPDNDSFRKRYSLYDFMTGQRLCTWPALSSFEIGTLDPTGMRFASPVGAAEGGTALMVAVRGQEQPLQVPTDWRTKSPRYFYYFGFAGPERIVVVPPGAETLEVWSAVEMKKLGAYPGKYPRARCAYAVSPGGAYLAMSSVGDRLQVMRIATGEIVGDAPGMNEECYGLAFSLDGTQLAGRFGSNQFAVWNVASGERTTFWRLEVDLQPAITVRQFNSEGRFGGQSLVGPSGKNVDRMGNRIPPASSAAKSNATSPHSAGASAADPGAFRRPPDAPPFGPGFGPAGGFGPTGGFGPPPGMGASASHPADMDVVSMPLQTPLQPLADGKGWLLLEKWVVAPDGALDEYPYGRQDKVYLVNGRHPFHHVADPSGNELLDGLKYQAEPSPAP